MEATDRLLLSQTCQDLTIWGKMDAFNGLSKLKTTQNTHTCSQLINQVPTVVLDINLKNLSGTLQNITITHDKGSKQT